MLETEKKAREIVGTHATHADKSVLRQCLRQLKNLGIRAEVEWEIFERLTADMTPAERHIFTHSDAPLAREMWAQLGDFDNLENDALMIIFDVVDMLAEKQREQTGYLDKHLQGEFDDYEKSRIVYGISKVI